MRLGLGKYLSLFVCLLFGYVGVHAKVSMDISVTDVQVGDTLTLELKVDGEAEMVVFPHYQDTITGAVELWGQIDSSDSQLRKYVITSFDTGYHVVPPQLVMVDGDSVYSNPCLLHVQLVPVDLQQSIKSIDDIAIHPVSWWDEYWLYVLFCSIVIILLIIVLLILKLRKGRGGVPVKEKQVPVIEQVQERIEKLAQSNCIGQGEFKVYYSELSAILRLYIEDRYKVKTHEKTSGEIVNSLQAIAIEQYNVERVQKLLNASDLVKFAKSHGAGMHNSFLEELRSFVEETMLRNEGAVKREGE